MNVPQFLFTKMHKISFSQQKDKKNKVVTGYILYSREVRKRVVQNNPESNFGEISKIVGNEWRSLTTAEKQAWEEKASKLNEETKALLLLEEQQCPSPSPAAPNPDQVKVVSDMCTIKYDAPEQTLFSEAIKRLPHWHISDVRMPLGQLRLPIRRNNRSAGTRNKGQGWPGSHPDLFPVEFRLGTSLSVEELPQEQQEEHTAFPESGKTDAARP